MKAENSKLFIGLGLGLLVGAAIGIYLTSSNEEKAQLLNLANSKVGKIKDTVCEKINESLDQLDSVTDKASQVAHGAISKAKEQI